MAGNETVGAAKAAPANVNVRYGVYNQAGNFAQKTVKQVRTELAGLWDIPADASAYNGKEKLAEDTVLQPGMSIEFHRRAGEKGLSF